MSARTLPHEENGHLASLDERAHHDLREMIVQGVLRPGEQLVQEALAERLGVSRTPLRKAIATLAQEGFVEMTSRGVAYVRSFSREELISIWEIRAVLEGLVCRMAAQRARPQHAAYLRSLITSAAAEVTPDDWTPYRDADREFHGYIASVVDDPLLSRILNNYQILAISLGQGLLRPPEETLPEHLEILDALQSGDAERAERAMVRHIRESIVQLRSSLGDLGALPPAVLAAVREALASLAAQVGETACLVRREEGEAAVVASAEPRRMLRVACPAEARLPLHATAAGKVLLSATGDDVLREWLSAREPARFTPRTPAKPEALLAELARVRRDAYAVEQEEHETGVAAMAVPVLRRGHVVGAVSVLMPAGRVGPSDDLRSHLDACAREIARAIPP